MLSLVYQELREVASAFFRREGTGHTLQPTALVHEAYVRMVRSGTIPMADHRQFLAVAARAIRQVLVDHARGKDAQKRGGDWRRISLDHALTPSDRNRLFDILSIDEALTRLGQLSQRQARIVELRFFAGMNDDEIADALGVSTRTVRGDWQVARAWLRRELGRS
jgi:RNA polymerase sigma-70 factor (ECF subfamily)